MAIHVASFLNVNLIRGTAPFTDLAQHLFENFRQIEIACIDDYRVRSDRER